MSDIFIIIFFTGVVIASISRTAIAQADRIQFAPGSASTTISAELKAGRINQYRLRAKAFQEMTVQIWSKNEINNFEVSTSSGSIISRWLIKDYWRGILPINGEYIITVRDNRSTVLNHEKAGMENSLYTLKIDITDNNNRKVIRPTPNEIKKVCDFIAASHSGSVKGKTAHERYIRSGKVDVNNDQLKETMEYAPTGTMGGEYFQFINSEGQKIDIKRIGFEWKDYWTHGERVLPYGSKTYLVHFKEESLAYPSHVTYVDAANYERVICTFNNEVTESVDPKYLEDQLCASLLTSKRPQYILFEQDFNINDPNYIKSPPDPSQKIDFDNDGRKDRLLIVEYSSGAGRGCGYTYYELIDEETHAISKEPKRDLLRELQGMGSSPQWKLNTYDFCNGNIVGWFIYEGITYFEAKYPELSPEIKGQEFHFVSYIENGILKIRCNYVFKVKTIVSSYIDIDQ